MSLCFPRRCSSSSATCSSMVATRQGSRPRSPRTSRSRAVNAASLLSSGCPKISAPRDPAVISSPVLKCMTASPPTGPRRPCAEDEPRPAARLGSLVLGPNSARTRGYLATTSSRLPSGPGRNGFASGEPGSRQPPRYMARPTYTTSAKAGSSRWPLRFTTVVAVMSSSSGWPCRERLLFSIDGARVGKQLTAAILVTGLAVANSLREFHFAPGEFRSANVDARLGRGLSATWIKSTVLVPDRACDGFTNPCGRRKPDGHHHHP